MIAGLIALGSVVMATVASVAVVGAMMMVSGIAEIINAFSIVEIGRAGSGNACTPGRGW